MKQTLTTVSLVAVATILLSCGAAVMPTAEAQDEHEQHDQAQLQLRPFAGVDELVAVIHPTADGEASGVVRFRQADDGQVTIVARVEGLEPNQRHGFHVHEFGDCSADDATSAGSHYNPEDHPHGLPNGDQLHAGDLGNLEANENGVAELELTVDNITLAGSENPVIGRAVIVHANEDDGSQPTGDAGGRIGCGVLGVANSAAE